MLDEVIQVSLETIVYLHTHIHRDFICKLICLCYNFVKVIEQLE